MLWAKSDPELTIHSTLSCVFLIVLASWLFAQGKVAGQRVYILFLMHVSHFPLLRACPWSSLSPFMLGKVTEEFTSLHLGTGVAEATLTAESNPHFLKCTESSQLYSPGLSGRKRISRQGISMFCFLFEQLRDFSHCHLQWSISKSMASPTELKITLHHITAPENWDH